MGGEGDELGRCEKSREIKLYVIRILSVEMEVEHLLF